jgi:hypothetical protein
VRRHALALGAAATLLAPGVLRAQDKLIDTCATATALAGPLATARCNLLVQSFDILQPPLGLAMSGGNPVPGTASTLGMRIGKIPRVSADARVTFVGVDLPQILHFNQTKEIGFTLHGFSLDGSVGLLKGKSPLPTVGGVGSVDLIASIGLLPLPTGPGFADQTPFSWALGLRGGLARESFTLPGVSVSALYRHTGRATFGDTLLKATESFLDLQSISQLSVRAAASKRIFGLGVTAGLGWDRYSSDVGLGFLNPEPLGVPSEIRLSVDGQRNSRISAFTNLSYTLLILHLVGELGWQQGAGLIDAPLPPGVDIDTGGSLFGGLAFRISI